MATKQLLNIEAIQESFFEDTYLLGISCSLANYQFITLINNLFNFSFTREIELDIVLKLQNEERRFPVYQYIETTACCNNYIYHLKNQREFLLPELNNLDFLWMIQCQDFENKGDAINQLLRKCPEIILVQTINYTQLKNVNNLIL